ARIVDADLRPHDGVEDLAVTIAQHGLRHDLAVVVRDGDRMRGRRAQSLGAKHERLARLVRHVLRAVVPHELHARPRAALAERAVRDAHVEALVLAGVPAYALLGPPAPVAA